jgi:hypothetical protein
VKKSKNKPARLGVFLKKVKKNIDFFQLSQSPRRLGADKKMTPICQNFAEKSTKNTMSERGGLDEKGGFAKGQK